MSVRQTTSSNTIIVYKTIEMSKQFSNRKIVNRKNRREAKK